VLIVIPGSESGPALSVDCTMSAFIGRRGAASAVGDWQRCLWPVWAGCADPELCAAGVVRVSARERAMA